MRPITGLELVAVLLVLGSALGEQLRREEPLREVVDPAIAFPTSQAKDPGLGEGLEDGAHLVRRPPVPLDGRARFHVGR
ncbi:MAG: hypothetical protein ABJC39_10195 [Chloroflexota bacterium]